MSEIPTTIVESRKKHETEVRLYVVRSDVAHAYSVCYELGPIEH